jgi:hypothetical protein
MKRSIQTQFSNGHDLFEISIIFYSQKHVKGKFIVTFLLRRWIYFLINEDVFLFWLCVACAYEILEYWMGKFVGKKVRFGSFLVVLWFRTVVNYRSFSVFSESKLNFERRKNLNGLHYGVEFRIGGTIKISFNSSINISQSLQSLRLKTNKIQAK